MDVSGHAQHAHGGSVSRRLRPRRGIFPRERQQGAQCYRNRWIQRRTWLVSPWTHPFLQGDIAQANECFREALDVILADGLAGLTLADCRDWLAVAAADAGDKPRTAAVLFGAADAQWHASGGVRYAPEWPRYEAELARVHANLPANEFAAAWAEGCAFSREQAINYAREQLRIPG